MVLRHTSPQTGIIGFYAGHPTTREAVPRRPGILIVATQSRQRSATPCRKTSHGGGNRRKWMTEETPCRLFGKHPM